MKSEVSKGHAFEIDRLIKHAHEGRLTVFAGAGLSVPAPTFLPSWWDLQAAVVKGLATDVAEFVGEPRAREFGGLLVERQREEKLPPEYQAQILSDRLGAPYFDVLRCLDGDVPNAGHFALVALAKAGFLRAILTTNFDRVIEAAFSRLDTPLAVCAGRSAFERFAQEDQPVGAPCQLFKLHGSAEDPASLIDTLAQRKIGLPPATVQCVRQLLRTSHWLFLGYSGLDLAAEPNYLSLRGDADHAVGFTWLVRTGTNPRRQVEALVALYGPERGEIVCGELPAWLEEFARAAGVELPPQPRVLSREQIQQRKSAARAAVEAHARDWARRCEPTSSALCVSDLLRACGRPLEAIELLKALRESTPPERRSEALFARALCALGILRRERDELIEAEALFQQALPLWEQMRNERDHATTLANLALIAQAKGHHAAAANLFLSVAEFHKGLRDLRGEAAMTHNAALSMVELGRYNDAFLMYQREIDLVERCGDEVGRAGALQSLAELLGREGRLDEAEAMLSNVQAIQTRLGDERARAQAIAAIGDLWRRRGHQESASKHLHEAASIFERLGVPSERATVLSSLGRIAMDRGDHAEALRLFGEELRTRERLGNTLGAARALTNLGAAHIQRGELADARQSLDAASEILERMDSFIDLVPAQRNLATIALREGRLQDATASLRKALRALERSGANQATRMEVLYRLTEVLWKLGENQELLTLYREGLAIETVRGDSAGRARCLLGLGSAHALLGNLREAEDAISEAVRLRQSLGDLAGMAAATEALAGVALLRGDASV